MPNIIKNRIGHNLVTVKNKMFVFRYGVVPEVFDSISKKTANLKLNYKASDNNNLRNPFSMEWKVYIFGDSKLLWNDFKKNEFSEELVKKKIFFCIAPPQFDFSDRLSKQLC